MLFIPVASWVVDIDAFALRVLAALTNMLPS
jgi:hypothetical protein